MPKTRINLLPPETSGVSEIARVTSNITRAIYLVGAVFLLGGALAISYIFILTSQIADNNRSLADKRGRIQSLGDVEQKYIFVQDRIEKLKPILAGSPSAALVEFRDVASASLPSSEISEAEVVKGKMNVSYVVKNSSDLPNLFAQFLNGDYEAITLDNFNFNPSIGYIVGFELNLKK